MGVGEPQEVTFETFAAEIYLEAIQPITCTSPKLNKLWFIETSETMLVNVAGDAR